MRQVPTRDYEQSDFTLLPHAEGVPHRDRPIPGIGLQAIAIRDMKEKAVKKPTKSAAIIYEKMAMWVTISTMLCINWVTKSIINSRTDERYAEPSFF